MFGYLAYGSLVKKICDETQPCPSVALQPLHSLLTDAMSSHKEFEMLLALKSIGNAGQPTSLKPVMKFLSDNYPEYIQLEAVRAIVEICKEDPTK
ncbi:hypothetical protein lerEdw1_003939, partial [Lerista edwardsae]